VRESAIICGIEYAQNAFLSLDKNIQIERLPVEQYYLDWHRPESTLALNIHQQ
jgi:nicotinate-nucleotide pyrophosphorylase